MTRTGRSPRLGSHRPVPFVDVAACDAARAGLVAGDLAELATAHGRAICEVAIAEGQQPGSVFVPIHWSGETSSDGRIGALVHPATDPFSGQPELKATAVAIAPAPMRLRGFVLARDPVRLPAGAWWARVAVEGGTATLFATRAAPRDIAGWAAELFPGAELAEYVDDTADVYRCAAVAHGVLVGTLFVGPASARPQWEAAKALFAAPEAVPSPRHGALSERVPDGQSSGPLVCACFGVGLEPIRDAIVRGGATTPEAIGAALRAGTNCGSCVPELRRIVGRELNPLPA